MEAVLHIRNSSSEPDISYTLVTPAQAELIETAMSEQGNSDGVGGKPIVSFGKFLPMHEYINSKGINVLREINEVMFDD